MSRIEDLVADSWQIYQDAVHIATKDGHALAAVVVLFSGGNDSTTVAHMFRNVVTHAGHANTGIGIEDTRQYVRDTCRSWSLPLLETYTRPNRSYREMVLGEAKAQAKDGSGLRSIWSGFPGPSGHSIMFRNLKERGMEEMRNTVISNPRKERLIFITGIRQSESQRRAKRPTVSRKGSAVFASPIAHWDKLDMNAYRRLHTDVPENEVSGLIHMSGECLCGAFAHPGELDEIGHWFPDVAQEIRSLEKEAAQREIKRCTWGQGKGTPCEGVCNL